MQYQYAIKKYSPFFLISLPPSLPEANIVKYQFFDTYFPRKVHEERPKYDYSENFSLARFKKLRKIHKSF